jgi:hypothetical protein
VEHPDFPAHPSGSARFSTQPPWVFWKAAEEKGLLRQTYSTRCSLDISRPSGGKHNRTIDRHIWFEPSPRIILTIERMMKWSCRCQWKAGRCVTFSFNIQTAYLRFNKAIPETNITTHDFAASVEDKLSTESHNSVEE